MKICLNTIVHMPGCDISATRGDHSEWEYDLVRGGRSLCRTAESERREHGQQQVDGD